MSRSAPALYLYCLVEGEGGLPPASVAAAPDAPPGLPGASPPRALDLGGGLALVASDVPLPEYSAAAIEEHLADLEWVSARALAHERVVEHFAAAGTVLPMQLFTLFTDEERARADVAGRRPRIARTLARLRGMREWGVRISFDPAAGKSAASETGRNPEGAADAPPSGRDFLRRKQLRQEAGRELARNAERAVESAYESLAAEASAARRREPQEPAPAAGGQRLLLDAAFLVPRQAAAFEAALARASRELAAYGCEATLTGPWPPYNFVEEG